ncbi:MAG: zinc ribbon domain-containing protein [Terriglobales bacterium]
MLQSGVGVAPAARNTAVAAGILVAATAVVLSLRLGQPILLLGLAAAAAIAAGMVVLGLQRWPTWSKATAGILALAGSAALLGALTWVGTGHPDTDPVTATGVGLASSVGVGLMFLAGGWVYRDARRRGLNAGAWAVVAIVVFPYLIGLIAYLVAVVLRDQRMAACEGCCARLPQGAAFCIRCGRQACRACPGCRAPAVPGAAYCAHCGATLAGPPPGAVTVS